MLRPRLNQPVDCVWTIVGHVEHLWVACGATYAVDWVAPHCFSLTTGSAWQRPALVQQVQLCKPDLPGEKWTCTCSPVVCP